MQNNVKLDGDENDLVCDVQTKPESEEALYGEFFLFLFFELVAILNTKLNALKRMKLFLHNMSSFGARHSGVSSDSTNILSSAHLNTSLLYGDPAQLNDRNM